MRGTHQKPDAAGLLLVVPGNAAEFLLAKRSGCVPHAYTWSVPAGLLERGETPQEGAIREADEELGAFPDFWITATVTSRFSGRQFHTVIAETENTEPITATGNDSWEISECRWVTYEQAQRLPLHPGLQQALPRLRPYINEVSQLVSA